MYSGAEISFQKSRMSFSPQRKPNRPPRPNMSYGNRDSSSVMSLEDLNSTSSSQILSAISSNQGNLPDYHNISTNAASNSESPGPINTYIRRGSDGDRPSSLAAQEQVRKKQPQRTRSKSMRQKARPCITIVSAAPMSQHPAFADGAKGSYIPPEAPPSYDEAMKAPMPRNPSFTDPTMPDHISQQRRFFSSVETSETSSCVSSLASQSEAETQPKYLYRHLPESAYISRQVVEPLVVSLPDQSNTNHNNSEVSPVQSVLSESETSSRTNFELSRNAEDLEFNNLIAEQHPVPTPRTKRRVSTYMNPIPSCTSTTLNTGRLQPTKPRKKPSLSTINNSSSSTNKLYEQQLGTQLKKPDILCLIKDQYSDEVKNEPQPMHPSLNKKLRPPPRPTSHPQSKSLLNACNFLELKVNEPGSSIGGQDSIGVADHQEPNIISRFDVVNDSLFDTVTSNSNMESTSLESNLDASQISDKIEVLTEVKNNNNLNDYVEKHEPVYAQVKKPTCKPLLSRKPVIPVTREALPETEPCAVGINVETTPPPIPIRPHMEDYIDTVVDDTNDNATFGQVHSSNISHTISPSSSVDNLYETVSHHKYFPKSQISSTSSQTRTPKGGITLFPVIPPPLPTSRPVGNLSKETECQTPQSSHMSRRASSGEELKKDKNAIKIIRRKSAHFKERGMKLFQKKTLSDDVEKPNSASHNTNQNQENCVVKPKKVPPPRPALPVALQMKHQQPPDLAKGPQTSKTSACDGEEISVQHLIVVDTSHETNNSKLDSNQVYPENEIKTTSRARPARPPPKKPDALKTTSCMLPYKENPNTPPEQPVPKPRKQPQVSVVTTNDDSLSDMQPILPFVKPKPARPPPALLSNPMIPIQMKSTGQANPPREIQPEVDEKMKQYIEGEQHCIATMAYKPTDFTHLALQAGEKVLVIKVIDNSTLFGRNESGEEGPFPKNYVKPENAFKIEQCSQLTTLQNATANQNSNSNNNKSNTAGSYVVALFTYQSNNSEDLNFKTGDTIKVLEKVSEMWLKGEIHGSVGLFPLNFVEPCIPKTEDLLPKQSLQCVALYDFMGSYGSGFSFKQGDTIELIQMVGPQWFEGKHNDVTGIFPSNYIKILPKENNVVNGLIRQSTMDCSNAATETPINPCRSTKMPIWLPVYGTAIALYDFIGKDENELSFNVDDVIEIKKEINNEWLEGKLNGKTGMFPVNFVHIT